MTRTLSTLLSPPVILKLLSLFRHARRLALVVEFFPLNRSLYPSRSM